MNQEERRIVDPDSAFKIDEFIEKLLRMCDGKEMPYHFVINDPSGNSFVQNPHAPAGDVYVKTTHYKRTRKQVLDMGFAESDQVDYEEEDKGEYNPSKMPKELKQDEFSLEEADEMIKLASKYKHDEQNIEEEKKISSAGFNYDKSIEDQTKDVGNINNEAINLPLTCDQCGALGMQKSCISTIPHFKEIIIMAFNCEHCGHKSVEVKEGGGMSDKGKRITLNVENERDLVRDLFKGDS